MENSEVRTMIKPMNKKANIMGMIIAFVLTAVFFYAMVTFGVNLAVDNNSNISILDEPIINQSFVTTGSDLETFQETQTGGNTEGVRSKFEDSTITAANTLGGGVTPFTVFNIVKDILGVFSTFLNTMFLLMLNFFADSIVLVIAVVTGLLLVVSVSFAWRWLRTGN